MKTLYNRRKKKTLPRYAESMKTLHNRRKKKTLPRYAESMKTLYNRRKKKTLPRYAESTVLSQQQRGCREFDGGVLERPMKRQGDMQWNTITGRHISSYGMLCNVHRYLFTGVSGQPNVPIFKGQAVQEELGVIRGSLDP